MRIGYLGDGAWAHHAIDLVLAQPEFSIVFIGARHQNPDPILKAHAERCGVPFFAPARINAPEIVQELEALKPDVIVSMSYDQIIRRPLLTVPRQAFINCHAGALPFYRGRNVLNWALINGEASFGVTVHHVDEGIDTGDIIHQVHIPIGKDEDYGSVLAKAVSACPEALLSALQQIERGAAPRIPQHTIHPVGLYCGRRIEGDEIIDWSWPAQRLHNFIRALAAPAPGARAFAAGREFALLRSELVEGAPVYIGTPGEVVGKDSRGFLVKTSDSVVRLSLVRDVAAGDVAAAALPKLPVGTRFTANRSKTSH